MAGTATARGTTPAGNTWLDGLLWGTRWSSGGRDTVISTYVAGLHGDETVKDGLGSSVYAYEPYARELAAMKAAMASFEAVCRIDFRTVGSLSDADLVWSVVDGSDSPNAYGWATPPGYARIDGEARSLVAINYQTFDPPSGSELLARGGFDYCTFIHELGHAVGLAHPHDHGGGTSLFPGVSQPFGDLGAYGMNQGVFTMMSYNDGWRSGPDGPSPSQAWGFQAGPMALDIAALQHLYGANNDYRDESTVYRLPDSNRPGTYYSCLWDTGGTDRILGAEGRANVIDLRAATLEGERGGGGFVSHADGVHGGVTIAHGVVIEIAKGGALADRLRGNDAGNLLVGLEGKDRLSGHRGDDRLAGGGGHDELLGGGGDDRLIGAEGADRMAGGAGADDFVFQSPGDSAPVTGRDRILNFERGEDRIVLARIGAGPGASGDEGLRLDDGGDFASGELRQTARGGDLLLELNLDGDPEAEMAILVLGTTIPLEASDFAF